MNQTLYDVLGVPPDVLQQGIRKAYQREALRWHPDKNAGDTIAKERFQTVGGNQLTNMSDWKRLTMA